MALRVNHYFWDSCCFIAYLNDQKDEYDVVSLQQFIDDARDGKAIIYTSTIALAEVRPSFLTKKSIGSFSEFVEDLSGALVLIDASPNIMISAGYYKDLKYTKSNSPGRHLGTPDAVMLATCIYLEDVLGVSVDAFHTYDNGRRRGDDGGKCVPLLSYEEWCGKIVENEFASRIIRLTRRRPIHPEPKLPA